MSLQHAATVATFDTSTIGQQGAPRPRYAPAAGDADGPAGDADGPRLEDRWGAERYRRILIGGLPEHWTDEDLIALLGQYVDVAADARAALGLHRQDDRAHVTLPTAAAAQGVRMALNGVDVGSGVLYVVPARATRPRVLRHDGPAQAHRMAKHQASERERRRPEDRETVRLRDRGETYRAIAAALGRSLGWVQRSLARFKRGGHVLSCAELGHLPCALRERVSERVSGTVRSVQRWRGLSGARRPESNQSRGSRMGRGTGLRTVPDTPPPRRTEEYDPCLLCGAELRPGHGCGGRLQAGAWA